MAAENPLSQLARIVSTSTPAKHFSTFVWIAQATLIVRATLLTTTGSVTGGAVSRGAWGCEQGLHRVHDEECRLRRTPYLQAQDGGKCLVEPSTVDAHIFPTVDNSNLMIAVDTVTPGESSRTIVYPMRVPLTPSPRMPTRALGASSQVTAVDRCTQRRRLALDEKAYRMLTRCDEMYDHDFNCRLAVLPDVFGYV